MTPYSYRFSNSCAFCSAAHELRNEPVEEFVTE